MKKVLIVDDAMFMRSMIKMILEQEAFEIVGEAADGHEAISQYKKLRPDIVTLDVTMPNLDGLSALKEIIAFDPAAKVVMVTAMGNEFTVMEAINSGAKNFLVKPLEKQKVIETLSKV